ncbi:MAG: response regulator [Chloroflexota bacterium]|nr:response regulator [Chloroflexota bacterium]
MSELGLVLCIEDDPEIQALVKFSLEATRAFAVLICNNTHAAFNLAATCSFDLILLEARMPGIDGLLVYKILRSMQQTARTPVIFLSNRVQTSEVERYKQMGILEVIFKPFDPLALPQVIKNILDKASPQHY